jgi:hypothetical protein
MPLHNQEGFSARTTEAHRQLIGLLAQRKASLEVQEKLCTEFFTGPLAVKVILSPPNTCKARGARVS